MLGNVLACHAAVPVALVMATVCWASDVCWKVSIEELLAGNLFKMVDHTPRLVSSQVTTLPERKSQRDAHTMIDRLSLGKAASNLYDLLHNLQVKLNLCISFNRMYPVVKFACQ